VSGTDREWTHFAADVTVQTTGGAAFGRATANAYVAQYHVERVRQGDGRWRTTVTRAGGTSLGAGPRKDDAVIGRVEHDDAQGTTHLFTRDGKPVSLPSAADLQQQYGPGKRALPTPAQHDVGQGAQTRETTSRWTRAFSIDPGAVDDVRARLRRNFQLADRASDGAERYLWTQGEKTVEVTLDPAVGQVREVRASAGGRTLLHTTDSYTALPNGLYARTGSRVERVRPGAPRPVVTTITYSNLTLDRNGGQ
jgi:hypothetical protein